MAGATRQERPRLALIGLSFLASIIAFCVLLANPPAAAPPTNYVVYNDSLHWDNWSWKSTVNPTAMPSPIFAGSYAMSVDYQAAWAGLSLHTSGFNTSGFSHLELALLPAGSTLPNINVSLYNAANQLIKAVKLAGYATAVSNGWYKVSIPLADLGGTNKTITRVQLQDGSGTNQPPFHIDELRFVGGGAPPPPPPPPPGNTAPTVNAGADQTITLPAPANLDGTVTDDGLIQPFTVVWSKLSGPGTVTFAPSATVEDPTASFSVAGNYVLRLEANDGALSASDYVTLSVKASGQAADHVVFGDTLNWDDWSWSTTINPSATPTPVFAGAKSMAVDYHQGWAGLSLHTSGFNTTGFSHLEWAILPAVSTLPNITVSLYNASNQLIKAVKLLAYTSAVGNGWYKVSVPLTDLGGSNTSITRVQLQDGSGTNQPPFHIDDLKFVGQGVPLPPPPVGGGAVLEAHFDTNADGFIYRDDAFGCSSNPSYASGTWIPSGGFAGGALQVELGDIDKTTVLSMWGGWRRSFNLASQTKATLSFRYHLTQTSDYESDEFSQVLVTLDGIPLGNDGKDYVAQLAGNGNGGGPETTGWQSFQVSLGTLAVGEHTLTIGGYNNKKTYNNESTKVLIDDVLVLEGGTQPPTSPPSGPGGIYKGPLFDAHLHLRPNVVELLGSAEALCRYLNKQHTLWALIFYALPPDESDPVATRAMPIILGALERIVSLISPRVDLATPFAQGKYTAEVLMNYLQPKGPLGGVGEIALYREELQSVTFQSPPMQTVFKVVNEMKGVVMIHPSGSPARPTDLAEIEPAIHDYPDVTFLFHGGKKALELIAPLMDKYPNVYFTWDAAIFSGSWGHLLFPPGGGSAEGFVEDVNQVGIEHIVKENLEFLLPWLEQYPDRIMWGTDRLNPWHFDESATDLIIEVGRRFVAHLPAELQEQYAFRNAVRIFGHYLNPNP